MTDSSAQFRPAKDGNDVLGARGLRFPAPSPLAARALIFIASIPKSPRAAAAFLPFAFVCFKGPGVPSVPAPRYPGGEKQHREHVEQEGFFARSKPQGSVYRSACDIRVVGATAATRQML